MKRAAVGLLALVWATAAMAMPEMPARPRPADTVLKEATAFAVDVDRAQKMERHLKLPYVQRRSQPPLLTTIIPPDMLPGGYHPQDRSKLPFTYEIRRTVERNKYESEVQRSGVDWVSVTCDGDLPTLDSASNLERGVALLLLPNAGREAHEVHVAGLLPSGRVGLGTSPQGTGRVRFSDGEHIVDVTIPFDGSVIQIHTVVPDDNSF